MNRPVRWARFRTHEGHIGFGVLQDDRIAVHRGDMFDAPRPSSATVALGDVALLAPCEPSKMIALWNNFTALSNKLNVRAPAHPLFLIKPGTSIAGPGAAIRRPAGYAGKIAFEGELGIVIGRRAKNVPIDEAPSHIFGYTCVNDVTAADLLNETPDFAQWCRAKGYDTFGCLGPVIATQVDLAQAHVVTRTGDAERQNYPLSDMIMAPSDLVSRISHDMTLLPGDVIACGTSLGVGSIRDGATVEISIPGIGTLTNSLAP
jgi:2-keto-4-pentenoate hydratase/2-oxohepta-3-ene-1,7-dioic acid hydratase in catechol pathway